MTKKLNLLYTALVLTALIAVFNVLALKFYFYWSYWWFDWVMHFSAGVAGSLSAYWVLSNCGIWQFKVDRALVPVLSVAICVLVVGVAWEVFEFTNGMTDSHEGLQLDVINDLIADTLGAILAAYFSFRHTQKSRVL